MSIQIFTYCSLSFTGNVRLHSPKSVFRVYVQTFDRKELAQRFLTNTDNFRCVVKPYRKDIYNATPEIWIHSYPAKNETCFPTSSTNWMLEVNRSEIEPPAYARGITTLNTSNPIDRFDDASNLTLKVDTWFEPNGTNIIVLATVLWEDLPLYRADVTAVIVPVDSAYKPKEIKLSDFGDAQVDSSKGSFKKNQADIMKGDGVYTAFSDSCGASLVIVTAKIKDSTYTLAKNYNSKSTTSWENVDLNQKRTRGGYREVTLETMRTFTATNVSSVCEDGKVERTTKEPTEPWTDPGEKETTTESTSTTSITTLIEVTSTKIPTVPSTRRTLPTRKTTTPIATPSSTISSTTSTQMPTQSTTASTPIPSTQKEETTTETESTISSTLSSSSTSTSVPSITTSIEVTSTKIPISEETSTFATETTEYTSTEPGTTSSARTTSKVNIGKKPKYSGLTRSTDVKPTMTSTVPTTSTDKATSSSGNTPVVSVLTVIFIFFWHLV